MSQIVYRIDREDRLVHVNEAWTTYANANADGADVTPTRLLGRRLWESIADQTTEEIYRRIVTTVRSGKLVRFHYRCDAPAYRRLFEMRVELGSSDEVVFTSSLVDEQQRDTITVLEHGRPRGETMIRICSWCQRLGTADGAWVALEKGLETEGLLAAERLPQITHVICKECSARMHQMLDCVGVAVNPTPVVEMTAGLDERSELN
ncbi:MAG: hypothetical protein ABIZ04_04615 [Opitutus sp.]